MSFKNCCSTFHSWCSSRGWYKWIPDTAFTQYKQLGAKLSTLLEVLRFSHDPYLATRINKMTASCTCRTLLLAFLICRYFLDEDKIRRAVTCTLALFPLILGSNGFSFFLEEILLLSILRQRDGLSDHLQWKEEDT